MVPILLTFWPFMETLLEKNKKYLGKYPADEEVKIQRNIMTTMNAIGTIILVLIYFKTQNNMVFVATILYPLIFYIYDAYYIWFNNENNKGFHYIIHHLAGIYLLQCIYFTSGDIRNKNLIVLMCVELSNLPLYYVYHFLKVNNKKDLNYYEKLINMKRVQLSIYGILRIVISGYILFQIFKDVKHKPIFTSSMILIYLMGAYWLQHQIKGYFITKKEYNDLLALEAKV